MKPTLPVGAHIEIRIAKIPHQQAVSVGSHHKKTSVVASQETQLLVLLMVLLGAGQHIQATIVVVLGSADRIVIAADSRQKPPNDLHIIGRDTRPDDSACKVWMVGSTVFAASGDVAREGGYDVRVVAPRALSQPGSPADKYRWSVRTLQAQQMLVDASKIVLILAAFDQQHGPSIAVGKVLLPLLLVPEPEFNCVGGADCTVALTATVEQSVFDQDAAYARMKQRPTEEEMITLAQSAVSAQARATPKTVGGPTDILVLDGKGGRWIQVKPECDKSRR